MIRTLIQILLLIHISRNNFNYEKICKTTIKEDSGLIEFISELVQQNPLTIPQTHEIHNLKINLNEYHYQVKIYEQDNNEGLGLAEKSFLNQLAIHKFLDNQKLFPFSCGCIVMNSQKKDFKKALKNNFEFFPSPMEYPKTQFFIVQEHLPKLIDFSNKEFFEKFHNINYLQYYRIFDFLENLQKNKLTLSKPISLDNILIDEMDQLKLDLNFSTINKNNWRIEIYKNKPSSPHLQFYSLMALSQQKQHKKFYYEKKLDIKIDFNYSYILWEFYDLIVSIEIYVYNQREDESNKKQVDNYQNKQIECQSMYEKLKNQIENHEPIQLNLLMKCHKELVQVAQEISFLKNINIIFQELFEYKIKQKDSDIVTNIKEKISLFVVSDERESFYEYQTWLQEREYTYQPTPLINEIEKQNIAKEDQLYNELIEEIENKMQKPKIKRKKKKNNKKSVCHKLGIWKHAKNYQKQVMEIDRKIKKLKNDKNFDNLLISEQTLLNEKQSIEQQINKLMQKKESLFDGRFDYKDWINWCRVQDINLEHKWKDHLKIIEDSKIQFLNDEMKVKKQEGNFLNQKYLIQMVNQKVVDQDEKEYLQNLKNKWMIWETYSIELLAKKKIYKDFMIHKNSPPNSINSY